MAVPFHKGYTGYAQTLQPNAGHDPHPKSAGFQNVLYTNSNPTKRPYVRVTVAGTSSTLVTEPVETAKFSQFRSDAVTLMLEMAYISRTANKATFIHLAQYNSNSVSLNLQGSGQPSQGYDTIVGCVQSNQANMYAPSADRVGLEMSFTNFLQQPLQFTITDNSNNPINDMTECYLSFVVYERQR